MPVVVFFFSIISQATRCANGLIVL